MITQADHTGMRKIGSAKGKGETVGQNLLCRRGKTDVTRVCHIPKSSNFQELKIERKEVRKN